MSNPKVYFCPRITSENLIKVYKALGREAKVRIVIKLSTGISGSPNHWSKDKDLQSPNLIEI